MATWEPIAEPRRATAGTTHWSLRNLVAGCLVGLAFPCIGLLAIGGALIVVASLAILLLLTPLWLLASSLFEYWRSFPMVSNRAPLLDNEWLATQTEHAGWLAAGEQGAGRAILDGRDLCGQRNYGLELRGASFKDVDAQQARFRRCGLQRVHFDGANLDHTSFVGSDLRDARFWGASLRGADLRECGGLTIEHFASADLSGARLPEALCDFPGVEDVGHASKTTRSFFFALLLGCVYTSLTVAATTDVVLIKNTASLALPIIGTNVAIVQFYLVAPLLLASVYIYFLFMLDRLCQQVAELPAILPDGRSIDQYAHPWIFNCLLSTQIPRLRLRQTLLQHLQFWITGLLFWAVVPATLMHLWLRYLCRHDATMSYTHALLVAFTLFVSVTFVFLVIAKLHGGPLLTAGVSRWRTRIRNIRLAASLTTLTVSGLVAVMLTSSVIHYGETARPAEGATPVPSADIDRSWSATYERSTKFRLSAPNSYGPALLRCLALRPYVDVERTDVSEKPERWTGDNVAQWRLVGGARLRARNLNYAMGRDAFLVNADLRETQLVGADLNGADLRLVEATDCQLSFAILELADLRHSDLRRADLFHAELIDATLDDCLLDEARFDCAQLVSASLCRAEMHDATFDGANLSDAVMNDVQANDVSMRGADLTNAQLRGAQLLGAWLNGANLTGAQLQGANLMGAHLQILDPSAAAPRADDDPGDQATHLNGANLSGANLSLAELMGANFAAANLSGANLTSADVSGANFTDCILTGCDFAGVTIDEKTNFTGANTDDALNFPVLLTNP